VAGFAALVGNLDFAIARGRLVGFDIVSFDCVLREGEEEDEMRREVWEGVMFALFDGCVFICFGALLYLCTFC
jgi:hypothetical protein